MIEVTDIDYNEKCFTKAESYQRSLSYWVAKIKSDPKLMDNLQMLIYPQPKGENSIYDAMVLCGG